MARLRDSYGATSQPGERAGLLTGCFAGEAYSTGRGVVCGRGTPALGHSQPNVPRWTDACEMLASVLTPLANYRGAVVNLAVPVQDRCTRASHCGPLPDP